MLIDQVCGQIFLETDHLETMKQVCLDVRWKHPSQKEGGKYARCGAWPRASAVLAAVHKDSGVCCDTLRDDLALQCEETDGRMFFLPLAVGLGILVVMMFVSCFFQAQFRSAGARRMRRPEAKAKGAEGQSDGESDEDSDGSSSDEDS